MVERCGRLPLAVWIAATRWRGSPALTLTALSARLQEATARLHELDDDERSVTAAFQSSYRGLAADQRRLLALHPGNRYRFHDRVFAQTTTLPELPVADRPRPCCASWTTGCTASSRSTGCWHCTATGQTSPTTTCPRPAPASTRPCLGRRSNGLTWWPCAGRPPNGDCTSAAGNSPTSCAAFPIRPPRRGRRRVSPGGRDRRTRQQPTRGGQGRKPAWQRSRSTGPPRRGATPLGSRPGPLPRPERHRSRPTPRPPGCQPRGLTDADAASRNVGVVTVARGHAAR